MFPRMGQRPNTVPLHRSAMAQPRRVALSLRTVQMILLALMSGGGLFATMAFVMRASVSPNQALQMPLFATVLGAALVSTVAYWIARRTVRWRLALRRGAAQAELQSGIVPPELSGLAILGAALAEGVGLLGVVTFLLTHRWPALLAPGLAMALIALQIPSAERARQALRENP